MGLFLESLLGIKKENSRGPLRSGQHTTHIKSLSAQAQMSLRLISYFKHLLRGGFCPGQGPDTDTSVVRPPTRFDQVPVGGWSRAGAKLRS